MLFMVIEHFKNRDAVAVYRRFQEQGRMMPEGLNYVGSWVEANARPLFPTDGMRRPALVAAVGVTVARSRRIRYRTCSPIEGDNGDDNRNALMTFLS